MHTLSFHLRACLARNLLEPSPIRGVYWSPSIPGRLENARLRRAREVRLELGDFLIAEYSTLATAKRRVQALVPGCWAGTEIHHIVENFHLQFLGVVQAINEDTYVNAEPCVLMAKKQHDTHIDNIVGGAEKLIMETRPFDFVVAFRDAHPGIASHTRTRQAVMRANWVRAQEALVPPTVTRQEIRNTLLEIYRFAYQESELEPLRLIADAVIGGMPL